MDNDKYLFTVVAYQDVLPKTAFWKDSNSVFYKTVLSLTTREYAFKNTWHPVIPIILRQK